ncbi:MAG: integrase [Coxiella sp. (in: Bacteria)]|nr:MAG: integrase [Coxiella sp. (in: g-proteobacteria)]
MSSKKQNNSPEPLFDTLEHTYVSYLPAHLADKYKQDYQHALQFLHSYRGSEATFNSYRRDVERLLHWCWKIAKKPLNKIKRTDFEAYVEFCQSPPAPWVGTKTVKRFKDKEGQRCANPDWRPFVVSISKIDFREGSVCDPKKYVLSQKSMQAIFSVLGSFYNYLIQEEYIDWNPVAQIRQKSKFIRKQQSHATVRRLSDLQWTYVIETAALLAQDNPDKHERTLFIMNALYGMYLRISELSAQKRWQPQMGDFKKDLDGHWWFTTVGKGNKERQISVSDAMLKALKRYRQSLGLNVTPSPGEQTPLILRSNGKGPISSTRHIRMIVQHCFDSAYQRMQSDGLGEDAIELKSATVHWLRHTGISNDVKHRPREHVRDDAGHGSSAITDKYIDIERRARHASAKNKVINPEES